MYLDIRCDLVRLTEYDANGFLGVQVDAYGEADTDGKPPGLPSVEAWHPYGAYGRPPDPDVDDGGNIKFSCATVTLWEGKSEAYALFLNDPRVQPKLPLLPKGGSATYGADGSFASFNPDTHTWTLYIPYEFDGSGTATKAHVVTVGKDGNGKPIVEMAHGNGQAITMLGDNLVMSGKGGTNYIEISESGGTLNGVWKIVGNITDSTGVSLLGHLHATGVGPSGPPLPGAY